MFTCPEKDIHSIYLDGELPDEYRINYETHVKSCKNCQTELSRLKMLHSLLQKDSTQLSWSAERSSSSYERLQSRLAFRKVVSFSQEEKPKFNIVKFTVPAAAAAAVFALVIPLRLQKENTASPAAEEITPIVAKASVSEQPLADKEIVVSGNISSESIEKMAEHNEQKQQKAPSETINSYTDVFTSTVQYLGNASNTANRQIMRVRKALASIDFLQPEFNDSQNAGISIPIPTAANIPVHDEIFNQLENKSEKDIESVK